MAFTAIRTATVEGVATITLARPDKLNAFTGVMHVELREALSAAEADDTVRCVVLTGAGRAFSAGQDLSEERIKGADGAVDFGARLERDYNPLVERLYSFPKVTIAALNGPTAGAAANVALACDILLAARSAYMQQAFARIALVPDAGGTWSLPRILGAKRALALMLTRRSNFRRELQQMGLVYKVFDDADFAGEVTAMAQALCRRTGDDVSADQGGGAGERGKRSEDPACARGQSAAQGRRERGRGRRRHGLSRKTCAALQRALRLITRGEGATHAAHTCSTHDRTARDAERGAEVQVDGMRSPSKKDNGPPKKKDGRGLQVGHRAPARPEIRSVAQYALIRAAR